MQSIAALEYLDQEAAKLREAFLAKNADVLLVRELYAELGGGGVVEEVENAREEVAVGTKVEVEWLVVEGGTL